MLHSGSSPQHAAHHGGRPGLPSLRDARPGRRLLILLLPVGILLLLASNSTPAAGSAHWELREQGGVPPPPAASADERHDVLGFGEALAGLDAETLGDGLSDLTVALKPTPTSTAEPTPTPEPTAAQPPPLEEPSAAPPQAEPRMRVVQPSAPAPTDPPPPPAPASSCPIAVMSGFERAVFDGINRERRQGGLAELAAHGCGTHIAKLRSSDMARHGYFSHSSPSGESMAVLLARYEVPFDHAGETLARNNYPDEETVAVAVQSLMESDGHRAIILDVSYTHLGVGFAHDGAGVKYFTLVFIAF